MNQGKSGWHPSKEEVTQFLDTQMVGRIGTLGSDGRPQIATVAFSQNDHLEIIIGTSKHSRKATNIAKDSRVAFEATDSATRRTVQFEGRARQLSPDEFNERATAHFEKLPHLLPYKDAEGQVYFLLQPDWIRCTDISVYPWVMTEFNFE